MNVIQRPLPPAILKRLSSSDLLESRVKQLPGYAYKLAGNQFGYDVAMPDTPDIDETKMSLRFPFADGNRRDGVGDLLEVGGIRTERHKANPIILFDHGKQVALPIALAEDRDTKAYTVQIDPISRVAWLDAFFYQGTGMAGVERSREHDHAIFCEQLFDLSAKRYIRSGSIGYQVIKALNLSADHEMGVPQGLHLLVTLMLEGSLVVMPANQDTVRKMLSMRQVCGKRLSPYLVKSLSPYAVERKVQMGYEGGKKGAGYHGPYTLKQTSGGAWYVHDANGENIAGPYPANAKEEAQAKADQLEDTMSKSIPIPHGDLTKTDVPPAKWKPGAGAEKKVRGIYAGQYAISNGSDKYLDEQGQWISDLSFAIRFQTRSQASLGITKYDAERMGGKIVLLKSFDGAEKTKALRKKYGKKMKTQPMPVQSKSLNLRLKYRKAKGLRRRMRKSSPGSSYIHVSGKDLERAKGYAEQRGLKFQHVGSHANGSAKVKLIGSDDAIDDVARQYGRKMKGLVGKTKSRFDEPAPEGLERIFSPGHQYYDRIYYDAKEGKYYDRNSDVYLTLDEAHAFGVKGVYGEVNENSILFSLELMESGEKNKTIAGVKVDRVKTGKMEDSIFIIDGRKFEGPYDAANYIYNKVNRNTIPKKLKAIFEKQNKEMIELGKKLKNMATKLL